MDGLNEREIEALATIFDNEIAARQLLEEAGLSRSHLPVWQVNAGIFWREVSRIIQAGVITDGRARILAAAGRRFPGNTDFTRSATGEVTCSVPGTTVPVPGERRPGDREAASVPPPGKTGSPPRPAAQPTSRVVEGREDLLTHPGSGGDGRWPGTGRPTRRSLLVFGGTAAAGAVVGGVLLTTRHGAGQVSDQPDAPAPPGVEVWDGPVHGASPLAAPLIGHSETVNSVAFSPNGSTLASASNDRTVRLWDVGNPAVAAALGRPLNGHTAAVTSVVFAVARPIMASGGADGAVQLWDVSDRAAPKTFDDPGKPLADPENPLHVVALSPDGNVLATAGEDRSVRLWNISRPAEPELLGQPLTGHGGVIRALAFSADGKILASGSDDRTVRLWDLAGGAPSHAFDTVTMKHDDAVWAVAFSPHRLLATGGDDRAIRLWDLADPTAPKAAGTVGADHTDNRVSALAFSPAGTTLAEGGNDRLVRLWNVAEPGAPRPSTRPLTGHRDSVWSVSFSPDGRVLASGSGDASVRLWALS
ncbi:hypothetical protein CC117_20950 [Parafrankia colletiae]|uniref:Effector-associated domain-containing protein n=1 Tax=Parafrankia colletiae TaxID=573497 RepID=A0A1S1QN38_9ACTN|nr:hypothetical protein CC117_20950 [Parafrankia colletiae]